MTACRLAQAGLRVALLERGRAYPPGGFPRNPHQMRRSFWDPSEGLHLVSGEPNGVGGRRSALAPGRRRGFHARPPGGREERFP